MNKRFYLLSAILGVLLNLGLMLLPTILLGKPRLMLDDGQYAAFLLIMSFWIMLEATGSDRAHFHHVQAQAKWLPNLMSAILLILFLTSVVDRVYHAPTPFTILAMIGGIVMIAGVILRYLAIRELGSYFLDDVTVVSGQPLVTGGIYSRLRHPSEAGNLCIAFGSCVLLGSLVGLVICTVVLLPIVLFRIKLEDRLLMQHYPQRFKAYSRDVPAIFLW